MKWNESSFASTYKEANSEWIRVRHIPKSLEGWDPNGDKLSGSEEYGDSSNDDEAWAINFKDIKNKLDDSYRQDLF